MNNEKDFKDLPEGWKWVRLGEVIEEVKDRKGKTNISTVLTISNTEGLVDQTEFFGRNLSSKDTSNYKVVYKGCFVYNPARINVGSIALNDFYEYAIVSPMYSVFKTKEFLLPKYLSYWIQLPNFRYMVINNTAGSVRESLNFSRLITFDFFLPPLPEQQKIAEILETVDNAIEKTDKIIEKYKRIKQGLMQDLLTKGIDENGNIRDEKTHKFKDSPLGRIPEEWEVVRLREVAFITKLAGFEYTKFFDYSKEGQIILIRGLNIKNGKLDLTNIYTIPKKISEKLVRSKLNKGDIVLSYVGTIGECAIIPYDDKFHLAPNVAKISIRNKNIQPEFVLHYLTSRIGKYEIERIISSTTQSALSMSNIRTIRVLLPPLPEQQRIAEILSQTDQTIEKEQQYKEKLQRIKQGLMQDLLTGKVRVNHLVEEKENEQRYTSNFTRT
jgi:type I restriction enzyme S subunit